MDAAFPAVQVAGGLLPTGMLPRIITPPADLPGGDPVSYGLQAGESVQRYANRSFAYLKEVWRDVARLRDRAGDAPLPLRATRDRWLLVLLRELGYEADALDALPSGLTVDDTPSWSATCHEGNVRRRAEKDVAACGEYRTKQLILKSFDDLSS